MGSHSTGAPLPYADVYESLLAVIYESLYIIYEARFKRQNCANGDEDEIFPMLRECAAKLTHTSWAKKKVANNEHITAGIDVEPRYNHWLPLPRVSRLCLEAVHHAHHSPGASSDDKAPLVPSPLAILVDILSEPTRPESSAYGFSLARALLFAHFKIHPLTSRKLTDWTALSIAEVQDDIESFRIYARHNDNIHHSKTKPQRLFLAHFLAMNGSLILRFGTRGKDRQAEEFAQTDCLEFLKARAFMPQGKLLEDPPRYEFRLAPELEDLPDTQEILNSLMGVPMPIAGTNTVFFGGLQRSHDDAVVISVSGNPGTGKTSFALAMAAGLAPFGTRCLYFTFEEDPETLTRRALGVIPHYFRRTTLPNTKVDEWLRPIKLTATKVENVEAFDSQYISRLGERLREAMVIEGIGHGMLPGIAPVFVVIDSLTTLYGDSDKTSLESFCKFVASLRDLNCIVMLLSADGIPQGSRLEYLVDTVISLRHEGTDSADKKPFRLFKLSKTRLQMSRPGSHILHLSGDRGFRISPQLPSQLDSHKIHKTPLPDYTRIIHTLWSDSQEQGSSPKRLLDLYPRSRILIHGHGSSGKAALALKILMAHSVRRDSEGREKVVPYPLYKRPRIFVVSFLYPQEYYRKAFKELREPSVSVPRTSATNRGPEMEVMALTPGFLNPEDFIGWVLLEMNRGILEGWPYTGVLIDGLHNTFLQFPSLQGSDMVWPALYSILSRYDLTIVTTFTTFSKSNSSNVGHNRDDEELILKGQLPFLHVLVQGADFYLQVESRFATERKRTYRITVESAQGQRIPSRALIWNADSCCFEDFESIQSPQLELPL